MKIAVNARLLQEKYYTGIQSYIQNLYQAICSLDKKNEYMFIKKRGSLRPFDNALFDTVSVKKDIGKANANIYHSPCNILPLGKKLCSYIVTVHDLGYKVLPQYSTFLNKAYLESMVKRSLAKADLVITDSAAVKKEIVYYYNTSEQKIRVVPLGVDPYFLRKDEPKFINAIKQKYRLSNKKIVLTNSAHSPRKNINLLIDAFINNKVCFQNCTLIICGVIGKDKFTNIKVVTTNYKYPDILLLRYASKREMRALYQLADLFVYPSVYEGFGLPVLEAMASSCPLLAADIPSIRELLPRNDLLFDCQNQHDLVEKMNIILAQDNRLDNSLSRLYKTTIDNYQWSESARKMIQIFKTLQ